MHCSEIRRASEEQAKTCLSLQERISPPFGKKEKEKKKRDYSQVKKKRKERECQSVKLFTHQAREV